MRLIIANKETFKVPVVDYFRNWQPNWEQQPIETKTLKLEWALFKSEGVEFRIQRLIYKDKAIILDSSYHALKILGLSDGEVIKIATKAKTVVPRCGMH